MNKEVISDKQGIIIIAMLLSSTASLSVRGIEAKQDFWISIILGIIITIPMALIYSRLYYIIPNKDLFDVFEICFGKFIGKIMVIFYTYYFLETGILVLLNASYFINLTSLDETPKIIIKICIVILCAWAVKLGIQLLGRWAEFIFLLVLIFIAISVLLSIPNMDLNNIRPILNNGIKPIIKGTLLTFSFPFGEIVVFYVALSSFKSKKSPYKVYILGLLISGIVLLVVSTTNILVLGAGLTSTYIYPTNSTMSRIAVGNAIERIEIIMFTAYILGAFLKISIYLLATSKGIAKTFNFGDYRFLVIPTALVMLILSQFFFEGILGFWEYVANIWPYYTILFQLIFPIILFMVAQIRKKQLKTN